MLSVVRLVNRSKSWYERGAGSLPHPRTIERASSRLK
jgi:hypothetical protein